MANVTQWLTLMQALNKKHTSNIQQQPVSRHDTIEEFNVDSNAEYSALSSTRSQKLKQTNASAPLIQSE